MAKQKPIPSDEPIDTLEGSIGSFFLDSGAHSLYNSWVLKRKDEKRDDPYEMYRSEEFEKYLDKYAAFIRKFGHAIDYYANVDVIFNPELSWDILKRLEDRGLKPVPVVHHGTDMKWLVKHLEAGYEFIGIGGLGQAVTKGEYYAWADQVFDIICPPPSRKPIVRTHGFAMTSYDLLTRYPWWSVDSASWIKAAAYGMIYIPRKYKGQFAFWRPSHDPKHTHKVFDLQPTSYSVSSVYDKKERRQKKNQMFTPSNLVENFESQPKSIKALIMEWLEYIDLPLGKVDESGAMVEYGVLSHHKARAHANLLYFQMMADSKGPYEEQVFRAVVRRGFF